MRVLVLCSGNICRSPMGEALLAGRLRDAGVVAEVSSAGSLTVDRPPEPEVIELMAERGLDVTAHRSRLLTATMVAESDLVLGMAREHVRDAAMAEPDALARTFTLKELVRRGDAVGPRRRDEELGVWLARAGADRSPAQLLGQSDLDDVVDPMGRRFKVFKAVADEIDELTGRLVRLLVP